VKIALIAPTHLPARRANTLQVMKMAQAFIRLGHSVQMAVPGQLTPGEAADWPTLKHLYGLQVRFPLVWIGVSSRMRGYDFGWKAVNWARRQGVDLIFTRLPQAAAFASWLEQAAILEVHEPPHSAMGKWLLRRYLRGRGARRLVLISNHLLKQLKNDFLSIDHPTSDRPAFTLVAPDGVDLDRYSGLPEPAAARRWLAEQPVEQPGEGVIKLSADEFVAGYSGHFYAGRGTQMMLGLAQRLPAVRFLLMGGEPPDVARLREEAGARQLKNVSITGFVANAFLPRYQAACDLLLMPYQKQVAGSSGGDIAGVFSPLKLFEYLACGRPILSSDLPALREVLNPQNAVLLPGDDLQAWAQAIQVLQSQPDRRAQLAERARQDSRDYSWEKRAGRILDGIKL
jgi:glycosyltransferase involved in cell wall biosynthesis